MSKADQNIYENQICSLINNAPTAIAMFDINMAVIAASKKWKEEHFISGEIINQNYFDIENVSPDSKVLFQRVFSGEIIKREEDEWEREDGVIEYVSWEAQPWLKTSGEVGGILHFVENVTLKKIALEEGQRKNQILNGILNNLPVFVYKLNSDGIIIETSGAGLKILGYQGKDLKGRFAWDVFSGYERYWDSLFDNKVFLLNGKHNNEEWHFEHFTFPDNVLNNGIIGFALDITNKKNIEKELQKAREIAEAANISKSRFLANMSHEMRTPLNSILGFARILEKGNVNKDQGEYLDFIISSGDILLKLIGDILDLSKIEEGKLVLTEESFNLKQTIFSCLEVYEFIANEKGLQFKIDYADEIPHYVIGDAYRLRQVLINLVNNAIKFTNQGNVTTEIKLLKHESDSKEITLQICVSDTGIGVPKEKQERIFESFTQSDASTVREYGGSGLGLTIVRELVKLMRGRIELISPSIQSSKWGPGSSLVFSVKFLIGSHATVEKSINGSPKEKLKFERRIKVLIAEDNIFNQKLIEVILKQLGCDCDLVSNGKEAVEAIFQKDYSVLLMDVQMPELDGVEATKLIRAKKIDTPIIAVTANVSSEEIEGYREAGMNDFVGKPFSEKEIFDKIKNLVFKSGS